MTNLRITLQGGVILIKQPQGSESVAFHMGFTPETMSVVTFGVSVDCWL